MSNISLILFALMTAALLLFITPGIFVANRGHLLRNIALWLAIFLGVTLIYKNFGPGSPQPLFHQPDSMKGMNNGIQQSPAAEDENGPNDETAQPDGKSTVESDDFTPPKE